MVPMRSPLPRVALLSLLFACKNDVAEDSDNKANAQPVADAGSNQEVSSDVPVLLNGGGSYDPEGSALSFAWVLDSAPAGSGLAVGDPSLLGASVDASFTPDRTGTYVVSLVVTDTDGLASAPAYAVITVRAGQAPIANAGPDQAGREGEAITLDGSLSSDPTGRPLTYSWTLQSAPAASALTGLDSDTAVSASFTPDAGGIYVAALVVNNGLVSSAPDTAILRVSSASPQPPTAMAGDDIAGEDCTALALDGSGSFDPNGEPLTYAWALQEKPEGSAATNANFSSRSTVSTTFYPDIAGTYLVSLAVSDGTSWSAPDLLVIDASERVANTPPVVNAGLGATLAAGDAECRASGYTYVCASCEDLTVELGADASVSDADGDAIVTSWQVVSGDVTLGDATELSTTARLENAAPITISACENNIYELQLSATDCTGATTSDIVTYTVTCCGVAAAAAR